eukprot:746087-Hanusia_phi.AAC.9
MNDQGCLAKCEPTVWKSAVSHREYDHEICLVRTCTPLLNCFFERQSSHIIVYLAKFIHLKSSLSCNQPVTFDSWRRVRNDRI